jgi:anti-sigma factor RsiW
MTQPEQAVPAELTCQELVELVTDYIEGMLQPAERVRFESHLGYCPGCETYLEQMRLTIRAAGRLTEDSIEPAARDRLLDLFRDWKRSS